jgi:molybdopterin biosynthesis enzyme
MNMATKDLPIEEARDRRLAGQPLTSAENCPITACRDRDHFEDTIANTNIPPFYASAIYGFCKTFADVRYASPEAHLRLNIVVASL